MNLKKEKTVLWYHKIFNKTPVFKEILRSENLLFLSIFLYDRKVGPVVSL